MPTIVQTQEARAWLAAEITDDISGNLIGDLPALNAALRRRGVNGVVTEISEDRDQHQLHVTVRGDEEAGDIVHRALNPLRPVAVEIVVDHEEPIETEPSVVYGASGAVVGRTRGYRTTRPTSFRVQNGEVISVDITVPKRVPTRWERLLSDVSTVFVEEDWL